MEPIWTLYFETMEPSERDKKDVKLLNGSLATVFTGKDKEDWELVNHALNLVRILVTRLIHQSYHTNKPLV